jgi:hypothetical protein
MFRPSAPPALAASALCCSPARASRTPAAGRIPTAAPRFRSCRGGGRGSGGRERSLPPPTAGGRRVASAGAIQP